MGSFGAAYGGKGISVPIVFAALLIVLALYGLKRLNDDRLAAN